MQDQPRRILMLDTVLPPQARVDAQIRALEASLADFLAVIERGASLSKSKREAWCWSIRRGAKFLERDPAQLPARLLALRFGITRLHHAQLGVSRKTLQNHIANLKSAVHHFASSERLTGRGIPLTTAWKVLYEKLAAPRLRLGLSSFLRYCSA